MSRSAPFVLYMALLALRPVLEGLLPGSVVPWLYGLQVSLVAAALWVLWPHYSELHRPSPWRLRDALTTGGLGLTTFMAWIQLDLPLLSFGLGEGMVPPEGEARAAWIAIRIAGAALVVPVMEELFWRSFLMRWLQARDFVALPAAAVGLRAVLASSLVFGLEHQLWFAGLLAGLVYAWLYRRHGLWSAIVAHGVTNAALGAWVVATGRWGFW